MKNITFEANTFQIQALFDAISSTDVKMQNYLKKLEEGYTAGIVSEKRLKAFKNRIKDLNEINNILYNAVYNNY